jgi:homogentisate 1,2-dioxygenase
LKDPLSTVSFLSSRAFAVLKDSTVAIIIPHVVPANGVAGPNGVSAPNTPTGSARDSSNAFPAAIQLEVATKQSIQAHRIALHPIFPIVAYCQQNKIIIIDLARQVTLHSYDLPGPARYLTWIGGVKAVCVVGTTVYTLDIPLEQGEEAMREAKWVRIFDLLDESEPVFSIQFDMPSPAAKWVVVSSKTTKVIKICNSIFYDFQFLKRIFLRSMH